MNEFNPYAYWLYNIKGIGNATIKTLMKTAANAEEIYHMPGEDIKKCLSVGIKRAWEVERKGAAICVAKSMDPIEIIRAVDEFFSTYKG